MTKWAASAVPVLVVACGNSYPSGTPRDASPEDETAPAPLPVPDGEPLPLVDAVISTFFYGAAEDLLACAPDPEDESTHAADAAALGQTGFVLAYARPGGEIEMVRLVLEGPVEARRPVVRTRTTLALGAEPWVRVAAAPDCADGAACVLVAFARREEDGAAPTTHLVRVWADGTVTEVRRIPDARQPAIGVGRDGASDLALLAYVTSDNGPRRALVGDLLELRSENTRATVTLANATSLDARRLGARRLHRPAVAFSAAAGNFLVAWDASAPEAPGGWMLAALVAPDGKVTPAPDFALAGEDCANPCPELVRNENPTLPINLDCRVKAFWLAGAHAGVGGPPFAFTKYGCGGNGVVWGDFSWAPGPDTAHAYKALAATWAPGASFEWLTARGARDVACAPIEKAIRTTRYRFAPNALDPTSASACGVSNAQHLGQAIAPTAAGGPTLYLHTDRVCEPRIVGPSSARPRLFTTLRFD